MGFDFRLKLHCTISGLSLTLSYASSWLVVSVTLNRLFHILKPIRAKSFSCKRSARKVIIRTFLTSCLINFHYFSGLWVDPFGASYYEMCIGRNAHIQQYYMFHPKWLDGFFYCILPSCLIVLSNCLILWNFWKCIGWIRPSPPGLPGPSNQPESSDMNVHNLQVPPELPKQRARILVNHVNQSEPTAPNVGSSGQLMK